MNLVYSLVAVHSSILPPQEQLRVEMTDSNGNRRATSPPPQNQYIPYSRPPIPGSQQQPSQPPSGPPDNQQASRPQNAYDSHGPSSQPDVANDSNNHYNSQRPLSYAPAINTNTNNPQELATSVYDSPIAQHNPHSAMTYNSSVYSSEEPSAPPASGPSAPNYAAPPVPDSMLPGGAAGAAPAPLHPSGPAYDSRQRLPSQSGGTSGAYKPYVPPNSAY